MARIMPAKIWNRGKQIADNGNVQIDYLDNAMQEVEATVFGTEAYGVSVSAADEAADFCECPYFPDHGYCKHIAAVITLLERQQRPLEKLFDKQTDDLQFATLYPDDYLALSAEFEAQLAANPQAAAVVYQDKHQYDTLRADPTAWADFFRTKPTVTVDPLTRLRHLLQPASKQLSKPNGVDFLADLAMPEKQYFQPLQQETAVLLRLEVTLFVAEVDLGWGLQYEQRLFLKLRVADKADNKFYVVNDINAFLTAYSTNDDYQTSGKRRFKLQRSAFAAAEQQLLDTLLLTDNGLDDINVRSSRLVGSRSKYYLLQNYNFSQLRTILAQLPDFQFQANDRTTTYSTIEVRQFTPDTELVSGQIDAVSDGYDLTITQRFTAYIENGALLIKDNIFYQATPAQLKLIEQILQSYQNEVRDYHNFNNETTPPLHFAANSAAQLNDFIAYFKQIGVISTPPQLTVSPMTPHFDLTRAQQTLQLRLSYEYNGEVIASDAIAQHTQIKRNLEKEKQAQTYLQGLQFQQQEDLWVKQFADGATLYRFFIEELPNLRLNGVVTLTPALENLVQDATTLAPTVNVAEADGFLSVNFSFAGIAESQVDHVLQQLDVDRPFIDRGDGSIVLVDDQLRKVSTALARIRAQGKLKNGHVKVHAAQALAVQAALGNTAIFDQKFKQMTHNLAHPESFKITAPQPINANLRPYQKVGVKWLEMLNSYHFGGILADEMGLGKTLQLITFLNNHLTEGKTNLVISPASLIYNWQEEFAKFAPKIRVAVVDGAKAQRRQLINAGQAQVLITSYNSARLDIEDYQHCQLDYLVLDEAQFVKNGSTKTHQNLRKLTPQNTFALSGTPIENRAEELWAIFALVMPGLLPSKKAFSKLTPAEIAVRVKPFILRREKAAVLKDLPPKVESNLYSEMTKEQKTVYLAQLKQMQVKVRGMSGTSFVKNKIAILAGLTRLRQICDTPALYVDDYQGSSGKLEQLGEILRQAQANQHRVLIFSQFTSMLDIIETELTAQGMDSFILKGDTKPKDRLAMVNAFNAGAKSIFLISLKAGGTGLNLTGADTVILVDLWWNPAVEDQATARAHRIGQKKKVEVYRLITKGTIEEQIYKLQEKKRNFVDQVLNGTENKRSLTEAEVRVILGIE